VRPSFECVALVVQFSHDRHKPLLDHSGMPAVLCSTRIELAGLLWAYLQPLVSFRNAVPRSHRGRILLDKHIQVS